MKRKAYLSPDRQYRYWLLRVWDESLPVMANFGVNPSTADENLDDPTIRKDIGFASRNGFGGLLKLNPAAYRATDPKECQRAADPVGPENTPEHLKAYMEQFGVTKALLAWGRNGKYFARECRAICEMFPDALCLGRNPDGTPRHTLMLPYSTQLEPWTGREAHRE